MKIIPTHDLTPADFASWGQTELLWKELRETLLYEASTGNWYWLKTTSSKSIRGRKAGTQGTNYSKRIPITRNYVCFKSKTYLASRLAYFYMTAKWPRHTIDHRNRNSLDDRWVNLKDATYLENNRNRSNSRYKNEDNSYTRVDTRDYEFYGPNRTIAHI